MKNTYNKASMDDEIAQRECFGQGVNPVLLMLILFLISGCKEIFTFIHKATCDQIR